MADMPHFPVTKQHVVTRRVDSIDGTLNIAFNARMNAQNPTDVHPDSLLIDQLGGPSVVARALGYDTRGGVQRVHNWKSRGIPPLIRITRSDVFELPPANDEQQEAA